MLFQVEMTVNVPDHLSEDAFAEIKSRERDYAQGLMRSGEWRHLWRKAGLFANLSVFDVESVERLHEILTGLPLFPFMEIVITPLCRHPTSVREDDS